jgi:transposase
MVRNSAILGNDGRGRFARPPWTKRSSEWGRIDARLADDHLARHVNQAVELLDLTPRLDSYLGVGREALRPDLLLKLVLYEIQSKRPSPSQWARDIKESEPLRWLVFGIEASRTALYQFRDRLGPYLDMWNRQVLHEARERELTKATRASLDSSSIAASASRKLLANAERCEKRMQLLDEAIAADAQGRSIDKPPYWMGKTMRGRFEQRARYQRVRQCLRQRHADNAMRKKEHRKPSEKILVSWADPEAVFGLDKFKVYRPLYNVQLVRDLDSPLVLAYDVIAMTNDFGTIPQLMQLTSDFVGRIPEILLADSGYVSISGLEFCGSQDITLYAPYNENDHTAVRKKHKGKQPTHIPKSEFTWLEDAQTYQCPEGHLLDYRHRVSKQRFGHQVETLLFVCPTEHCRTCPRAKECTTSRTRGRQIARMVKEDLLEELIRRMSTDEAKALYKLRSRTVELNFADMKEHRGVRRFSCRGLRRVRNQAATTVLIHNLLHVHRASAAPCVESTPASDGNRNESSPLTCPA